MAITVSNISGCSVPVNTSYFTNPPTNLSDARQMFSELGTDLYNACLTANQFYTIFENDILRIEAKVSLKDDWNGSMSEIKFTDKRPSAPYTMAYSFSPTNLRHCYMALGYDEETQTAYCLITGQFYYRSGDWNYNSPLYGTLTSAHPGVSKDQMYQLISNSQIQPIVYDFESVSNLIISDQVKSGVVLSDDALDGWNGSDSTYSINSAKVQSLGNVIAKRGTSYSYIWGYDGESNCVTHFYDEANNWYYRALVIDEAIEYTQLTQSSSVNIYSGLCVDTTNEAAALITVITNQSDDSIVSAQAMFFVPNKFSLQEFYDAFSNAIPNIIWQSVPNIVGRDKTYRLTDILNINDGSAVNDVQASGNVDFSAKSKVNNMIIVVIPTDDSKVTVYYDVPGGSYQYVKLVYKKGSIPLNVDDGTAMTISKDAESVEVEGVQDGNVYWFAIFTDKSISDAVSFQNKYASIVLDSENMFVTPIIENFKTFNDVGGRWYIDTETDILQKSGAYGTSIYCSKYKLNKKNATIMYVDIEGSNGAGSTSRLMIMFYKQCTPNFDWTNPNNVYTGATKILVDTAYTNFARTTVACPLNNVTGEFYIGFWTADEGMTKIRKVYFNKEVEVTGIEP